MLLASARGIRWYSAVSPMVVEFVRAAVTTVTRRFPGVFRVNFRNRKGVKQLSRTWFIRYTVKGKQVRESTGKTDPEEAWNIRQERIRAAEQGRAVTNPRLVTAEDLRKLVHSNLEARGKVTAKQLHLWYNPVIAHFGTRPMIDVKPADLEEYISARKMDGAAPGSVSVELKWFARGFKLAVLSDRLPRVPPFPRIEFDNARRVFADWPEVERILPHLPPYLQPVALTAHFSGWRKMSILSRERALHLDLAGRWLYLERLANKGRAPVRIWLNDVLLEALREQDARAREIERRTARMVPWVFFYYESTSQVQAGGPICERTFSKYWTLASTAAGLEGIRFHDVRRGAIRELRHAGTENEVMAWVGIRSRATFDRYDIVDEVRVRELGERQQARHAQRQSKVSEFARKG